MSKYTEATEVINRMAELKMTMNAHKGNIEDIPSDNLMKMLKYELDELDTALADENMINIIEEAADIQNFLIGLVQQQIDRYRSRK